jgi:hypothetical protein
MGSCQHIYSTTLHLHVTEEQICYVVHAPCQQAVMPWHSCWLLPVAVLALLSACVIPAHYSYGLPALLAARQMVGCSFTLRFM